MDVNLKYIENDLLQRAKSFGFTIEGPIKNLTFKQWLLCETSRIFKETLTSDDKCSDDKCEGTLKLQLLIFKVIDHDTFDLNKNEIEKSFDHLITAWKINHLILKEMLKLKILFSLSKDVFNTPMSMLESQLKKSEAVSAIDFNTSKEIACGFINILEFIQRYFCTVSVDFKRNINSHRKCVEVLQESKLNLTKRISIYESLSTDYCSYINKINNQLLKLKAKLVKQTNSCANDSLIQLTDIAESRAQVKRSIKKAGYKGEEISNELVEFLNISGSDETPVTLSEARQYFDERNAFFEKKMKYFNEKVRKDFEDLKNLIRKEKILKQDLKACRALVLSKRPDLKNLNDVEITGWLMEELIEQSNNQLYCIYNFLMSKENEKLIFKRIIDDIIKSVTIKKSFIEKMTELVCVTEMTLDVSEKIGGIAEEVKNAVAVEKESEKLKGFIGKVKEISFLSSDLLTAYSTTLKEGCHKAFFSIQETRLIPWRSIEVEDFLTRRHHCHKKKEHHNDWYEESDELELPSVDEEAKEVQTIQKNESRNKSKVEEFTDCIQELPLDKINQEVMSLILSVFPKNVQIKDKDNFQKERRLQANTSYREARSHLFLAACGMEQCAKAFEIGDYKALAAIFPSLLTDWHVFLEQLLDIKNIQTDQAMPFSHSLVAGMQSKDNHSCLQDIDLGLLWARYPSKALSLKPLDKYPLGLHYLQWSVDWLKGNTIPEKNNAHIMISDLMRIHYEVLNTALNMGVITPSEECREYVQLYHPEGPIAERLEKTPKVDLKTQPQRNYKIIDKLMAELQDLLKMPNADVPLRHCISDVNIHLLQLSHSLRASELNESERDSFRPWHMRNLMNIQWIIEQLLIARHFAVYKEHVYSHDFAFFQSLFDPTAQSQLTKLHDYNFGIGVHYPWKMSHTHSRIKDFAALLLNGEKRYGLSQGFEIRHGAKEMSLNQFRAVIEKGLCEALTLISDLKKNL